MGDTSCPLGSRGTTLISDANEYEKASSKVENQIAEFKGSRQISGAKKRPRWATNRKSNPKAGLDEALSSPGEARDKLYFKRMTDANISCPSDGVISSTKYDSTGRMLLTAGSDLNVRVFVRDNCESYNLSHNLLVEGGPIQRADFLPYNNEMILLAQSSGIYLLNVESNKADRLAEFGASESWKSGSFVIGSRDSSAFVCVLGQQGRVGIAALQSRCRVASLNASGHIKAAVFSSSALDLITVNTQGIVNVWDLRMHRCRHQIQNDNFTSATSLALSPDDRKLAIGTANGTVARCLNWQKMNPDNSSHIELNSSLKTAVDGIHFNHNGELLLVSSSKVKDAVRVINIATANTIPHWPTSQTPLGYVFCSDFNPESTELALGNARGRVLIYNLLSYHKRENI